MLYVHHQQTGRENATHVIVAADPSRSCADLAELMNGIAATPGTDHVDDVDAWVLTPDVRAWATAADPDLHLAVWPADAWTDEPVEDHMWVRADNPEDVGDGLGGYQFIRVRIPSPAVGAAVSLDDMRDDPHLLPGGNGTRVIRRDQDGLYARYGQCYNDPFNGGRCHGWAFEEVQDAIVAPGEPETSWLSCPPCWRAASEDR